MSDATTANIDDIRASLTAMLASWDKGWPISTIGMGGIGPGYEQAIQISAIEMLRRLLDISWRRTKNSEHDQFTFDDSCSKVMCKIDESVGSITDAQFVAAKRLAFLWISNGDTAMIKGKIQGVTDDRIIQVSRFRPVAPPAPPAPTGASHD